MGKPGEQDYRLKHFPPGRYTASFVESDDVTGLPIFERVYRFDAEGTNTTLNPAGFGPSGTLEARNEEERPKESRPEECGEEVNGEEADQADS